MGTARITDDATATAYLASVGELDQLTIEAGRVVIEHECNRCGGTGHYSFNPHDGTRCFECNGNPAAHRYTERAEIKSYAQAVKRRRSARAKRNAERNARHESKLDKQRDWCEANGFGRITFAEKNEIVAAQRKAERAARDAASEHVGTVGERLTITVTVLKKITFDGYMRGDTSTLHIMVDDNDNKIVWFNSGMPLRESLRDDDADAYGSEACYVTEGDRITIKATVKEHSERDGAAQTKIVRAKLVRIECCNVAAHQQHNN